MSNQCFEMAVQLNTGIKLVKRISTLQNTQTGIHFKLHLTGKSKRSCSVSEAERDL